MATLGLVEAALEAWSECGPLGYALPEDRLPPVLQAVAALVPGGDDSEEKAQRLRELFDVPPACAEGGEEDGAERLPVFMHMLKACDGKVHFLYFWRAFGEAARLVAGDGACGASSMAEEGITAELETLRDGVLRMLEAQEEDSPAAFAEDDARAAAGAAAAPQRPPPGAEAVPPRTLETAALVEAVRRAAAMSAFPDFWRATADSLDSQQDLVGELTAEELAVVMLSWLHDAVAWQEAGGGSETPGSFAGGSSSSSVGVQDGECLLPVALNVYDVSQEESIRRLNKVLAHRFSPVKIGGVFHAGVEVNGLEWSYGFSQSDTVPGISCVEPRTHPQHTFRQTVRLRRTKHSAEDIAAIISDLIEDYPGHDYDLLRRNCCHFADDFCQRLGVGRIPGWVHRLARVGARVDAAMQVMMNRSLLPLEGDDALQ